MSGTYASSQGDTRAGAIILAAVSCLSAALVIAGLVYATGTGARHQAALAAARCEPNLSPSGLPCTTVQMLTSQYLAIVTPAGQQLNADATAYAASEGDDLAAAQGALTTEVTTERALGTSLAGFPFPPAVAPLATTLIRADKALATLTAEQARSSTLTQMRSFNQRVQAASAALQTEIKLVGKALDPASPGE